MQYSCRCRVRSYAHLLPLRVAKSAGKIGGKEVTLAGNVGYNRITGNNAPDFLSASIGGGIPVFIFFQADPWPYPRIFTL